MVSFPCLFSRNHLSQIMRKALKSRSFPAIYTPIKLVSEMYQAGPELGSMSPDLSPDTEIKLRIIDQLQV